MKYDRPGTHCQNVVKAVVFWGRGHDTAEHTETEAGNVKQCWISIPSDETFVIKCQFQLDNNSFIVDLVVDGILRATYVSRKDQSFHRKHTFDEAVYRVGHSTRLGPMTPCSSKISGEYTFGVGSQNTVGTLELRISSPEGSDTHTQSVKLPDQANDWRDLVGEQRSDGGVPIKQEIVFKAGEKLNSYRRKWFRDRFTRPRPGSTTWAVMKFHYRLEQDLRTAGLISAQTSLSVPCGPGKPSLVPAKVPVKDKLVTPGIDSNGPVKVPVKDNLVAPGISSNVPAKVPVKDQSAALSIDSTVPAMVPQKDVSAVVGAPMRDNRNVSVPSLHLFTLRGKPTSSSRPPPLSTGPTNSKSANQDLKAENTDDALRGTKRAFGHVDSPPHGPDHISIDASQTPAKRHMKEIQTLREQVEELEKEKAATAQRLSEEKQKLDTKTRGLEIEYEALMQRKIASSKELTKDKEALASYQKLNRELEVEGVWTSSN